jgi:hypothetical protein
MVRGSSFFTAESMSWMRSTCRAPSRRYHATFDGLTETTTFGVDTLDTWAEPIPGHEYVIGVDCRNSSAGGAGSGFNYAVVVDATVGVQVAEYAGLMGCNEFTVAVWRAAQKYNEALIVPETGGDGGGFIDYLTKVLLYWRVYERERFGKVTVKQTGVYGFAPSPDAVPVMKGRLQDNINGCKVEIRSFRLYDHVKNLNKHGGENISGRSNNPRTREEADDGAIALALTMFGHKAGINGWTDKRFAPADGDDPKLLVTAKRLPQDDWVADVFGSQGSRKQWAGLMDG